MLGKIEGRKRMDDLVMGREAWHAAVHGVVQSNKTEQLN